MKTDEIIKEIEKLPVEKRILVIEKSIHSLRLEENKNQMKKAANTLLTEYKIDKELTSFTDLDFENFY